MTNPNDKYKFSVDRDSDLVRRISLAAGAIHSILSDDTGGVPYQEADQVRMRLLSACLLELERVTQEIGKGFFARG